MNMIGTRATRVGAALAVLLSMSSAAQATRLPHDSVQRMCVSADLIVAGTHTGEGKVRVDHVFHASRAAIKPGDTIEVPAVAKHTKNLGWAREASDPIQTDRVVLFLMQSENGALSPIHTAGEGSQGLFWLDDKTCYGYRQDWNPGPYRLARAEPSGKGRVPGGREAMWAQVQLGLGLRKQWETIQAIKDGAERARRMAAYLLPHTAPAGYDGCLDLRKAIRAIGPEAVPALTETIAKARPTDNLNTTVLTLFDIGLMHPKALESAVPAVCKLLENPGPTAPYYILSPLQAAGDPRAVPHVRPLLKHKDKQVRGQAARTLAAMKDTDSFEAIVALIENPPPPQDRPGYTREVTQALFELDPVRGRAIIQRIEATPGNAGLHDFIHGYK